MKARLTMAAVVAAVAALQAQAVDPWPGETWAASSDLTFLGTGAPHPWTSNQSGVYWNPVSRRLWTCNNSGSFSMFKEDGAGSFTLDRHYSPGGDLEGITQADAATNSVYLMVENAEDIREYRVSDGALLTTWDLTPTIGALANNGTEGIAFVPDVWLAASGFRDLNGNLYPNSVHGANGLGGIMLVGVQGTGAANYGYVYAVDLKKDGTHTLVGRYKTSQSETADLAFDASIGRLYILHNTAGNLLEVTDLTSASYGADRKFTTLREIQVPSGSNIEGFGLTPSVTSGSTVGDRWCFFTDDNNASGALRWFKQLPSPMAVNAGNNQSANVSTAVAVPPSVVIRDAYSNALPGVAVNFAVTSGGGSCEGASTTTLVAGVATVGGWTLGPSAGVNTLSASVAGASGSPVSFTATGVGGADTTPPQVVITVPTNDALYRSYVSNVVVAGTATDNQAITAAVYTVSGATSGSGSALTGRVDLISSGAVWKYRDDGSDQGTAWRGTAFDDGSWASGPAELGYGDGGEATTNSYGPDANNKYATTYYRRAFVLASAAPYTNGPMTLRVRRDDGIVVYLNGTEVFRDNMPGSHNYLSWASAACGDDGTSWLSTSAAGALLTAGTNVVAAEIHQNAGTSTDISFDLSLSVDLGSCWILPATLFNAGTSTVTVVAFDAAGNSATDALQIVVSNDHDEDAMPDDWEIANFGDMTTATAGSDSDGDGILDRHEYVAGTQPTNAQSVLAITNAAFSAGGDGFVLRWPSVAGRRYSVFGTTNPVAGFSAQIQSNLSATPPANACTVGVAAAGATNFFAVGVRTE